VALIIANLVPLYGVLVWGWSVLALLVLFWLEIMLVGVLGVLRMLLADPLNASLWAKKAVWVPCFCVLYGIFVVGLGIMMFSYFGHLEGVMALEDGPLPVGETVRVLKKQRLWSALAALCASHAFSFFWNYLGHGEFRRAKLKDLMWEANSRVFILFFSLFFGALFMALGSPVWGLTILIGFKIWFDLDAHLKAHRQADSG
jgi:hypothetical protein